MGALMKQVLSDPAMQKHSKLVSKYAGSLVGEIKKLSVADRARYQSSVDEHQYLQAACEFLEKELYARIHVFTGDDDKRVDPENKARFAVPLRPAIYLK